MTDRAQQLSQMVEREVRMLIGDLHMQLIVTKSLMELSGVQPTGDPAQQPAPTPAPPQPQPEERPPGRPGPSPDIPPVPPTRSPQPDPARDVQAINGRARESIR